jgi:hypothetical protein
MGAQSPEKGNRRLEGEPVIKDLTLKAVGAAKRRGRGQNPAHASLSSEGPSPR